MWRKRSATLAAVAEQELRLATTKTSTDLLLLACKKYCCYIYKITLIYNIQYMKLPHCVSIQFELGKVKEGEGFLQLLEQTLVFES